MMEIERLDFIGNVSKVAGHGNIEYFLWVDLEDRPYVQFQDNDRSGTFSSLLSPVARYASKRNMRRKLQRLLGYDLESKKWRRTKDLNNGAFLKAVLRDVLPEKADD
jgi:hypothetical protein